jgi:hypothetical protein
MACDAEGEGTVGRVGLKICNDHTAPGQIKSTKIAVLHRRWDVLGGDRKYFQAS